MPPTNSPVLKYLRIAVIALSLTACVLLVVLWVRSYGLQGVSATIPGDYWRSHEFPEPGEPGPRVFTVRSSKGSIELSTASWHTGWTVENVDRKAAVLGFGIRRGPTSLSARIPHWYPVLVTSAVASVPWARFSRRYSLRTLLIATTLAAVGLGVIAISR